MSAPSDPEAPAARQRTSNERLSLMLKYWKELPDLDATKLAFDLSDARARIAELEREKAETVCAYEQMNDALLVACDDISAANARADALARENEALRTQLAEVARHE